MSTGTNIHIELLGPVRAWRDGQAVHLGPPKQRAVLGLLASRAGEVVGVEQIADAVWGSDIPQTAANGVHTYVAGLRRVLEPSRSRRQTGEVLVSAVGGYSLQTDARAVDTALFTQMIGEARQLRGGGDVTGAVETFEAALKLWRGEAFGGVPGPFAALERSRLQDLRLTAAEDHAACLLDAGRHTEAVGWLTEAIGEDPLRERLRGSLMISLYRSGRQAHALRVFRETCELLRDELGIDPSPELRELHRQILVSDPALGAAAAPPSTPVAVVPPLPAAPPVQLPAVPSGFAGRDEELALLSRELLRADGDEGAVRLAVVDGPPGVGKTAFALELAKRIGGSFPDGQLFVDLRGTDPASAPAGPAECLLFLLRSLGVQDARIPDDLVGRIAHYQSLVHARRLLIVLDDARSADQVRPLLPRGSSCVLVTSRVRLSGLVARDGAHRVPIRPLDPEVSAELLAHLAGRERMRPDSPITRRLAHLCGHLPLALRLAANAFATDPGHPPAELLERYVAEPSRLDRLAVADDASTSLRAALDVSFQALPDDAARMLRSLGAARRETITATFASAVTGAPRQQVQQQLTVLADNRLIEEAGPGEYRLNNLVALYARECAGDAGRERAS
ncbi:AfsR family transcriptional regulator [Actinoplanes sp. SE50]|uniref:AfsR/SARP family transcriptional regulator n=1 Tax=unclassified Actinoplanes TaxID=2626549 RepID=UPI00023EC6B6|nr:MULTISPECIES: AfsR/SARP family transcriptional regulator [unclassified Actinoplanes]AEV87039.1 Regulatory protein afsR [Actinoplanes sp. SE50/110]ATO85437.1 AfsR family transcriptional regulator [Actinoplanes sp. SE50]SLM02849.1 transcriptional regulator, AfsR family [Actinoplanes sp. SE50/110]